MTLLAAGLALFVVLHLIPSVPPLRARLVARMGERPYRGLFSLVALPSLVMVVRGFSAAPFEPVYSPPSWDRHAALGEEPDHHTWWAQRGGARAERRMADRLRARLAGSHGAGAGRLHLAGRVRLRPLPGRRRYRPLTRGRIRFGRALFDHRTRRDATARQPGEWPRRPWRKFSGGRSVRRPRDTRERSRPECREFKFRGPKCLESGDGFPPS